jgi:hypothetical protein
LRPLIYVTAMTVVFVAAALALLSVSKTKRETASNPRLERAIGRLATSVDRLAAVSKASADARAESAGEAFSQSTGKLGPKEKTWLAAQLAKRIAAKSGHKLSASLLRGVFETLFTAPGSRATNAAGVLLSLVSGLTSAERSAVQGVVQGFLEGASKRIGESVAGHLIDLFDEVLAATPTPVPTTSTTNTTLSFGNLRLDLAPNLGLAHVPPIKVVVAEPPTSFLWFNRTWDRDDRGGFERVARAKAIGRTRLTILYLCHPTVRKVFGMAAVTHCTK